VLRQPRIATKDLFASTGTKITFEIALKEGGINTKSGGDWNSNEGAKLLGGVHHVGGKPVSVGTSIKKSEHGGKEKNPRK